MYLIGLTGSIGMGKSATADMFRAEGVSVYDADEAVHRLYEKGGAAVAPIGALFPDAICEGAVDRQKLGALVLGKGDAIKALEKIVHPLAGKSQMDFLARAYANGEKKVVLDIPLLFETKGEGRVDCVVVVSAPDAVQERRVLVRANMDAQKLAQIKARQMPDAQKRARADYIVDSSVSMEHAHKQVRVILADIGDKLGTAYEARLVEWERYLAAQK